MEIEEYLTAYNIKYPNETGDPTLDQIEYFIENYGSYYITDYMLILYIDMDENIEIIHYWLDVGDYPMSIIKQALKEHKIFVQSFDKPVFTTNIKELYKRKNIAKYDEKQQKYMFL